MVTCCAEDVEDAGPKQGVVERVRSCHCFVGGFDLSARLRGEELRM